LLHNGIDWRSNRWRKKHRRFAKGQGHSWMKEKPGIPSTAIAPVENKAVDKDGIVASPRLRQQLDERGRGQQFQIAH